MININFLKYLNKYGYLNTNFEYFLSLHYSKLIYNGSIVLDIGANSGYHTEKFINLVGNDGLVVAFEQIPEMQNILNQKFSKSKNFILLKNAVGNKNESSVFYKAVHSSGSMEESGLKIREFNDEKNTVIHEINVETVRLDDISMPSNVDFIKIDIEGGEVDAILGATNLINSSRPYISVEYGYKSYLAYENTDETLWLLAKDLGYTVFDIFLNKISSIEEWKNIIDPGLVFYWDFLLIPNERLDEFEYAMLQ